MTKKLLLILRFSCQQPLGQRRIFKCHYIKNVEIVIHIIVVKGGYVDNFVRLLIFLTVENQFLFFITNHKAIYSYCRSFPLDYHHFSFFIQLPNFLT